MSKNIHQVNEYLKSIGVLLCGFSLVFIAIHLWKQDCACIQTDEKQQGKSSQVHLSLNQSNLNELINSLEEPSPEVLKLLKEIYLNSNKLELKKVREEEYSKPNN